MANYITKITAASVTYDIMDVEARELISSLSQALIFVGVTTTPITDGASTPSTYGGLSGITIPSGHVSADTVDTGTVIIYDGHEFVWDGSKWSEFGSTYQWTPVLTKDSVLGADTTLTPTYTSTDTNQVAAHSHTIVPSQLAFILDKQNIHADASTPTVTPFMTVDNYMLAEYNSVKYPSTGAQSGSVASTVITGISTTGSGNNVISALTTSNKLVTASQSFNAGTLPSILDNAGDPTTTIKDTQINFGATGSASAEKYVKELTASANSDGVNTYTLSVSPMYMTVGSESYTFSAGTAPSATLASTVATGSATSSGTGATVVTGGTTSHLTTGSQSLSLQSTVATGSFTTTGTGEGVIVNSEGVISAQPILEGVQVSAPTITLSTPSGATAIGDVNFVKSEWTGSGTTPTASTNSAGAHVHTYDKDTGITVGTNDLVDAVTNVTLS